MPKKKTSMADLETAFNEVNQIIDKMEAGDIKLEESLEQFERGITLIKHCQKTLQTAEQKVQKLIQKNGKDILVDFDEPLAEGEDSDDDE